MTRTILSVLTPMTVALAAACGGSAGKEVPAEGDRHPIDRDAVLSALPEVDPQWGFRMDEGEFTVEPGQEFTYCVRIPIPPEFAGRDLALLGWDWELPQFTHHFFAAYSQEPFEGTGPEPCDGVSAIVPVGAQAPGVAEIGAPGTSLGEGKLLFGAGVGIGRYFGTEQYGRLMAQEGHFVTNHHVLNTGLEPVVMHGRFNMYVTDAALVPHLTNELNCLSLDVAVDPYSSREVTATCTAPFDLDLVLLASHAHNHLQRFETRFFDGQQTLPEVIYESNDWDSPELEWQNEPIHLKQGQGVTFTCDYQNDQAEPISFGVGVKNEMCATMNGYAFPADRPYERPPSLGAVVADNDAGTCLRVDASGVIVTSNDCSLIDTERTPVPIPFF
jgi:hypothetical protein